MKRKMKRVQDRWETGIMDMKHWGPQGMVSWRDDDWVRLVINKVTRQKFQPGDKVRVTVTLLERK